MAAVLKIDDDGSMLEDGEMMGPEVDEALASPGGGASGAAKSTRHVCPSCSKVFVSMKGLTQHQIIHTGTKPFICNQCGKAFRFKSNLFEHRSVHTGAIPYVCRYCGKMCRLKGNLKKHLKTHVKDGDIDEESTNVWIGGGPTIDRRRISSSAKTGGADEEEADEAMMGAGAESPVFDPAVPKDEGSSPKKRKRKLAPAPPGGTGQRPLLSAPLQTNRQQVQPTTLIIIQAAPPLGSNQSEPLSANALAADGARKRRHVATGGDDYIAKYLKRCAKAKTLHAYVELARAMPFVPGGEYVCNACGADAPAKYPTFVKLRKHLADVHRADAARTCEVCAKCWAEAGAFERHVAMHKRIEAMIASGRIARFEPPTTTVKL